MAGRSPKIRVRLLVDYWESASRRLPAGKIISLTVEEAIRLMNEQKAEQYNGSR